MKVDAPKARRTMSFPDMFVRAYCTTTGEILEGPLVAIMHNVAYGLSLGHKWQLEHKGEFNGS